MDSLSLVLPDNSELLTVGKEWTAIGFVLTIYQRRLASSFHALKHTLNNHFEQISAGQAVVTPEDEDLPQDEIGDEVQDADEVGELTQEGLLLQEREAILGLLRRIGKLGTDTKAKRLKAELEQAFVDGYDSAIVFTQYVSPVVELASAGGLTRSTPSASAAAAHCCHPRVRALPGVPPSIATSPLPKPVLSTSAKLLPSAQRSSPMTDV